MKDKVFEVLQRVGRSFMLPIAILPVAGLFLGIGGSFTNTTMLETYGLSEIIGPDTLLFAILSVMAQCGDIVFANLPLLFAIGVAIGMSKKEKEVAALSAVIAFMIMHTAIAALISINNAESYLVAGSVVSVMGIQSLQMGVFGGIIVGLGVAALHNRFYKIELPQVLSFFGGTRFVPIVSAMTYLAVGILMFYIWPTVQEGIYAVGEVVTNSGYVGTFVYGLMERLLIPFGLHHVFYLPFWQTAVGGTMMVDGVLVEGAQNIFFAQLASPDTTAFAVGATRFMSGKFPLMIFGLPGAALAMYQTAKKDKKAIAKGLLASAALTSMLTGITEPIEFTFLFIAPILYGIHCAFAGLAYMFMHLFNVGVGMTFSGGIIDLFLYGILQGNAKTNWIMIVVVGIVYFIAYYVIFRFIILKLDLKTPGREEEGEETKLYTRKDVDSRKDTKESGGGVNPTNVFLVQGLGGKDNIEDIDCCATRLRITCKDEKLIKQDLLKKSGASGVVVRGKGVQIIFGPRVSVIKSEFEDFLETASSEMNEVDFLLDKHIEVPQVAKHNVNTEMSHKPFTVYSPLIGEMVPLSEAPDESFAQEMVGRGVLLKPEKGELYAPCDAKITLVFPTKHAIGLETKDGIEILLHVGIDTVKLNGEPFEVFVDNEEEVKAGQLLVKFDMEAIQRDAVSTATPMVFTNLADDREIQINAFGKVDEKTAVLTIV